MEDLATKYVLMKTEENVENSAWKSSNNDWENSWRNWFLLLNNLH